MREGSLLRSAFELVPDYLSEARAAEGETNFADLGLQLTRTSRALKVWVSIQTFGLDAFRAAIDRAIELAEHAAERVESSDSLELLRPPSLGIVCFRRRFDGRTRTRRSGATQRSHRGARGERASASSLRRGCTGASRCGSAS